MGIYRKMHIPDDPLYYEKFYFTPGDLGFKAFDTTYGKIGTLVCWDQWYPEGARLTALQGAEIIFYPTAIGWHPSEKAEYGEAQHSAWETVMRAHAIANGTYVAAANRVGHELPPEGDAKGGIEFWGASFLADPFGRILKRASYDQEEVLVVTCDRKLMEEQLRHQAGKAGIDVDHGSAGKVEHARIVEEPVRSPHEVGDRRIDTNAPQPDKPEQCRELHAIGEGAAD